MLKLPIKALNFIHYASIYLLAHSAHKSLQKPSFEFISTSINLFADTYLYTALVEIFLLSNDKPTNFRELLFFELSKAGGFLLFKYIKNEELDLEETLYKFFSSYAAGTVKLATKQHLSFVAKDILSDSMHCLIKATSGQFDLQEAINKAPKMFFDYASYKIFLDGFGLEEFIENNLPDDKGIKYAIHDVISNSLNMLIPSCSEDESSIHPNQRELYNPGYNMTPIHLTSKPIVMLTDDAYKLTDEHFYESYVFNNFLECW
jgi:hypothetical protein